MEYNKFLHNGKKRWLVVSVSLLAALSGSLLMVHSGSNVHASVANPGQNQTSQQTQNNYTYQSQFHVDHSVVNDQNGQNNVQQNIKPQINNLCERILNNHVQASENIGSASRRTLGDFSVPSEINSQANYRNIEDGTIVEYDSMDGTEGSKINYSQYTNPNAVPAGFTFVKLGKHSNVYLPQNEPGGINTIWIAPISKTNSQPSSASSSVISASSSVASSSVSASSSESLSSEVIPPKPISNSVSNGSVNSGNQSSAVSSSSASASTNASVSSSVSSSSAAPSNSIAPSSTSSSVSSASASESTNVSSSASESQQASSTSSSVDSNNNAVPSNTDNSNSTSMTSGQTGSSNNNANESITPVSSSTSASNVTPASAASSVVPSSVSSSASSSSVNVNSNLNSWYASFMNSVADNHQSGSMASTSVSSNSINPIIAFSSMTDNNSQPQITPVTSVRHRHTRWSARHFRKDHHGYRRLTKRVHRHGLVHHNKHTTHHSRKGHRMYKRLKHLMKRTRHGRIRHAKRSVRRFRKAHRRYRLIRRARHGRKSHRMLIRLIKGCNEYRSLHATRHNRIRYFRKGTRLSIRRIVKITRHTVRFQLTNGKYIMVNKRFVKVIK